MAAPPEKKMKVNSTGSSEETNAPQVEEECKKISMVVGKGGGFSPVYRIKGYPWRLRLYENDEGKCEMFIRCEKSREAEYWECRAVVLFKNRQEHLYFTSLSIKSQERKIGEYELFPKGDRLEVEVEPLSNGDKWRARPIEGILRPRDGCLLIEGEPQYVNKEFLSSQSPYFDRLFNAEFKEKNMAEIPIVDIGIDEFNILMKMIYGENGASVVADLLTRENVPRILELVDRFEFKIIEDGIFNVLLSNDYFSIHMRLLIADQNNLDYKERVIELYKGADFAELAKTPEYDQLSAETKDVMYRKTCDSLAMTCGALSRVNDRLHKLMHQRP